MIKYSDIIVKISYYLAGIKSHIVFKECSLRLLVSMGKCPLGGKIICSECYIKNIHKKVELFK